MAETSHARGEMAHLELNGHVKPSSDPEAEPLSGHAGTGEPPGAKVGAKLRKNKYFIIIAGALFLLCPLGGLVSVLARRSRIPREVAPNSTSPLPTHTPGAVAPSTTALLPCPNGWTQNEKKCYFFSDTEANWNDSQSNCSSFGGSLVTMETQQEMDFIQKSKNHPYIWIGLRREEKEQPWKRPNGSRFNNWFSIQGEGDCAYWNEDKIHSTWCNNTKFWICSKPALTSRVML